MTLLLLDTSGDYAALAVTDNAGTLLAGRVFAGRRILSRRLLGEINGLLTSEGLTLADVTAFGVGVGPGSFTGVRVGVTTAKTFAQVTGKPLIAIPTLNAYAAPWAGQNITCVVVLPSRRGEAYVGIFPSDGSAAEIFAERIETLEERLIEMERAGPLVCCGVVGLLPHRSPFSVPLTHVSLDGMAQVAAARLAAGQWEDPLALTPNYLVAPMITTPTKKYPEPPA
jgi:tRNA threonylcarbamoyladenosine biosynthesis protein TsaB